MKTYVQESIERVRSYLRSGVLKKDLASQAGVPASVLTTVFKDDFSPTANTLRKLEAAIPPDFFEAVDANPRQAEERAMV